MGSLSSPLLVVVFAAGAVATWIAGTALSKTTDVLDRRFGFGEALGGVVLLAVAGSLPEVAITVSAAAKGHLGLAAGNLIGGVAVQTLVLVICDAVASRDAGAHAISSGTSSPSSRACSSSPSSAACSWAPSCRSRRASGR